MGDHLKQGETGTAPADQQGERLLTQAEVDAIVRERLARERAKYADYDALKQAAAQWQTRDAGRQSEQDTLHAQLQALQAQHAQAETRRREALLRSAVVAEAARAGLADPGDAFSLIDKTAVTVGDDDSVRGAAEAVAELVKAKPYLLKMQAARGSFSPANPAASQAGPDLGWLKTARGFGGDSPFSGGGVIEPAGE